MSIVIGDRIRIGVNAGVGKYCPSTLMFFDCDVIAYDEFGFEARIDGDFAPLADNAVFISHDTETVYVI